MILPGNDAFDPSIDEHFEQRLRHLSFHNVLMIDGAIDSIEEFGEVILQIDKGRLRLVVIQKSNAALKYRPGEIDGS